MTRVLISADMEGITGVTCPDDVEPGSAGWQRFRQLMALDVNAAVEGFLAAGAEAVTVNDAHASKRNVPIELLHDDATLVTGTHKRFGMMEGIDEAEAVAFVGYHTPAGTQGVLSHTYIGTTILDVLINGERSGEGRMNALLAAELGVPVVLVTGDDLTCADAAAWAPRAERVAVKTCIDRYTARCLPPARTRVLIRAAAERALERLEQPAKPQGPFTYEVVFDSAQAVVATTGIPGVEATGERSVKFTLPTMQEAIRCFRVVSVLAIDSTEPFYG